MILLSHHVNQHLHASFLYLAIAMLAGALIFLVYGLFRYRQTRRKTELLWGVIPLLMVVALVVPILVVGLR